MATTPSIKIVKSIPYRGLTRLVSNRYHFNGGTPADSAHWTTLADAIVAAEAPLLASGSGRQVVQAVGYAAGSDVPVFTKAYTTNGSLSVGTGAIAPGDAAALVRYATTARTMKNHPVYLFNYYHVAILSSATAGDALQAAYTAALASYAAAWIAGFSDGVHTCVRAGPNGATATGSFVEAQVTHRDLPRG